MEHRLTILIAAACLVAGCGGATGSSSTSTALPDEAERRTGAFELVPVAVSDPAALFSTIGTIDIDSQGNIYVLDFRTARVVVFNPEGQILREVGRSGQGPGEFEQPGTIQVLQGDSLLVYDSRHQRVTVFGPGTGEVASMLTLGGSEAIGYITTVRRHLMSNRYLVTPYATADDDPAVRAMQRNYIKLLRGDGSVERDSVFALKLSDQLVQSDGGMLRFAVTPFGRSTIFHYDGGEDVYVAWTDSLAVNIYSVDGERKGGFSYSHAGPPVAREEVDELASRWDAEWRRHMEPLLRSSVPETWPAMRSLIVDDSGRIWIQLGRRNTGPAEWAVFDRAGDYLGSVFPQENVTFRTIAGNRIYAQEMDPEHGPRVAVLGVDSL